MNHTLQRLALYTSVASLGFVLCPGGLAAQQEARAQLVGAYRTNYAARPLTLPQWNVRADASVRVLHLDLGGGSTNFVTVGGGVGLGLTDHLEVGLGTSPVAPIMAVARSWGVHDGLAGWVRPSSERAFVSPTLYARYRFVATRDVEVGLEVDAVIPANDGNAGVGFGVPLRLRAGESFALDASLGFLVILGDDPFGGRSSEAAMSLSVMPRFAQRGFYAGVDTGFFLYFDDPDLAVVPLFVEAGVVVGSGSATFDAYGRMGFPALLQPGSPGDKLLPETWELTLGVRAHFGHASR